ncbi:MAG: hypothetical protein IPI58_00110 [Alphaproteobacteria bacterium]|nr:MAG: hypothetical protein IPI58_00110 [Alphaproteobacteria bacterium]
MSSEVKKSLGGATNYPEDGLVELPKGFEDARGMIQPICDLPMKSAGLIASRPGTIRANHYHKTDWHIDHLIKGAFDYYWRKVGDPNPPKCVHVVAGQSVFSGPMTEHALRFTEDSLQLVVSGNGRSQEEYEADVVRVPLID